MTNINHYAPRSGRVIKEDNTVINIGEMIEALYNALVVNKDAGIQLTGSIIRQDPETAAKTVTATAAELYAGLVPPSGVYKLLVYNEGQNNVYWGEGTVLAGSGFPLLPGDSIVFTVEDVPIFFVAETDVVVRVGELA